MGTWFQTMLNVKWLRKCCWGSTVQANSWQHKVLVTLGIPLGWICNRYPFHTHLMYGIHWLQVQSTFNHSRQTLGQNTRSRLFRRVPGLQPYLHTCCVCMWLTSAAGWSYTISFTEWWDEGNNCDQKRTAHWFKKKKTHTLCGKYISKGTACMVSVICTAWFKHTKAVFKPQANTSELWITRCYCLNACTWEPLR